MLNLRDFWSRGGIYFKTFGPSVEMEAKTPRKLGWALKKLRSVCVSSQVTCRSAKRSPFSVRMSVLYYLGTPQSLSSDI